MENSAENPETQKPDNSDNRFTVVIYCLLGMIILLLIGLWLMERGHRNRAESKALDITQAIDPQQLNMQDFGRLMASPQIPTGGPTCEITRNELPTSEIEYNGQKCTALMLSASAGEKIGFLPGDIVIVTRPPSQPTSQQAEK